MPVLIIVAAVMFCVLGGISLLSHFYSLNGIKLKTVGDGQHGTARWATKKEIRQTYRHIRFTPKRWRNQAESGKTPTDRNGKPLPQGIVVGCTGPKRRTTAMIETGDVHVLMIGAAGVGKTAYWLYPCLEYACATGMSFLSTDTKGDLVRNYGSIAEKCFGYHVSVIDLRNPTKSNGNNLLHLVNKYQDMYEQEPDKLMYLHLWCLGLRVSEVCTLKGNAYIRQNGDTWIQVYQIKMREYKRVPMPEALYELMQIYLNKHQIGPEDYVFPSPKGGPYRSVVFCKQMKKFCKENQFQGGEYLFKSHDYRHRVATDYYDSGVSLQGIRDYLGHEHEEMTRQYIDFMPKRIEKANDEFFGQHSLASCLNKGDRKNER